MKLYKIKNLKLRRTAMVISTPIIFFQYLYIGARSCVFEFRLCWNYVEPEVHS